MSAPRIDKWLWAARFFRTRSLAQQAVEGGKVQVDGQRVKPGKGVREGMRVTVRKNDLEWTVRVTALADKRGSATTAQQLYEEEAESIERRERLREQRRLERASRAAPDHRPTKRERRQLERLHRRQRDD